MRVIKWLKKIGAIYSASCIIIVNVLIILIAFHFWTRAQMKPVSVFSSTENAVAENWVKKYGIETLRNVYTGKSDEEIKEILDNAAELPVVWRPWVLFQSAPKVKPYYAVHAEGFRFIGPDQGPWPIDKKNFNIFFFGGSTTYGAGVPDVETIPAQFQKLMQSKAGDRKIKVYNFGTGAYISTQEMLRFQDLIWSEHIPDAVVFIDGLNDFQLWDGTPAHADRYKHIFDNNEYSGQQNFDYFASWALRTLPMRRWLERQLKRWRSSVFPSFLISRSQATEPGRNPSMETLAACHAEQAELDRKHADYRDRGKIQTVITRYTNNIKMIDAIAGAYKIDAYFVWQPIPTYKYDRCYSPFHGDLYDHYRSRFGYPVMAEYVAEHPMPRGFIWCADIQDGIKANLYVDHVHYTSQMNGMLASCIAAGVSIGMPR